MSEPSLERSTNLGLRDVVRGAATLALVAAGLIHFAYAPTHLHEAFSHGLFFLAAGWLQLTLAAGLAFRIPPQRIWLAATALVDTAIVAVWVVSRTTGVPGSEAEGVGFPDVLATSLEVLVVLAATALLLDRVADRPVAGGAVVGFAGIGTVATITLVSLSVAPSFAGEHGPGQGGHDTHGGSEDEAAAGHGHTEGAAAEDSWAQTRVDALMGHASPEQVDAFKRASAEYLAEQIRSRSELLRGLPEAEREERITAYVDWAVENTVALLEGAQSNGEEGMHTHGPVEWQPITDPADQLALQQQLQAAAGVIDQFPTVADAEAGGYHQISPYVPGIGAHWIRDLDAEFDPAEPEMLLYNGTEPTSRLVGLSYATVGPEPPEGFVGPNDVWHAHPGLCLLGGLVVGIDGTPEELCDSIGGNIASGLGDLHMAHLWQVPGFESPWGMFSAENPNLNIVTSDIGQAASR